LNHRDHGDHREGQPEPIPPETNRVSQAVVDCAISVHRELGPGLLESVYELCLTRELIARGSVAERQVALPVTYKGEVLEAGLRIDLLVQRTVVVELKAIDQLLPIHRAQVLTYLKLSKLRVGLLINFNSMPLKNGIQRFAL
jgi:GxxExxY protein